MSMDMLGIVNLISIFAKTWMSLQFRYRKKPYLMLIDTVAIRILTNMNMM